MRKNRRKAKHSQRFLALASQVDKTKFYDINEAIEFVKANANTKFVEGVDLSLRLGVDPRKGDQNVRGITNLPHGTGKNQTVAVLAKGDLAKEATAAGADVVGDEDLIKRIQDGWKDFDVLMATTDMAPQIGKIARLLGPRTPNKKNGTVTDTIGQAVKEVKSASRVEYRVDKAGVIHMPIGRVNFSADQLRENMMVAVDTVIRAKPSSAKGRYLLSVTLSSTMGPGLRLDPTLTSKASGH